ncbi:MAG: hypothetical protein V5B44_06385 [Candidatus Accumulibacter necessarius]|jgi:hypothetical protein|uniref:hypothetical protein n=1 Tax=Candidatus Accumulibacter necessarius TaxID=2954386 RepID=UPI002FC3DC17
MLWSVEVGDILSPSNFVAIADALRADPAIFLQLDMERIRQELDERAAGRKATPH